MALVLLQLKLAIQRRSLGRSGGGQRAWYVLGWVLALVLGLGAGALVERMASADNQLGELGLLGTAIPAEYDGMEQDVTIGCIIVVLMKGPGYVADAYKLDDSEQPASQDKTSKH